MDELRWLDRDTLGELMKSRETQLWKTYRRSRSIANRNALVEHYWPDLPKIVGSACPRSRPPFVTPEDVSAAGIGLIQAVERFRVKRGASFRSTLYWCVRDRVIDDRRDCPIGDELGKRRQRRYVDSLPPDIAAETRTPDIDRAESRQEMSETVLRASSRLDFFLDMLSRQERRVIRLIRYEGMTNKQAARKMRVTPGRVSQLHRSALRKLRRMILRKDRA